MSCLGQQRRENRADVAVAARDEDPHRTLVSRVVDAGDTRADARHYRQTGQPPPMPINWDTVPEDATSGAGDARARCGSSSRFRAASTGDGVRETLAVLAREVPLELIETPSGTAVFDWTRAARVDDPRRLHRGARRNARSSTSPTPRCTSSATARRSIDRRHASRAARARLHPPRRPDLVPYRTSYWEEQWGFCMSRRQLDSLARGTLSRRRSTRRSPTARSPPASSGSRARARRSSCSAPTSAIRRSRTTTSRASSSSGRSRGRSHAQELALHLPPPLEPGHARAALLARTATARRSTGSRHGLALSCVGDPRAAPLQAQPARRRADRPGRRPRARRRCRAGIVSDWEPRGGDERQFCSPGFDLPVGVLSRTPHGLLPEYHSSADNLDFVSPPRSAARCAPRSRSIDLVETNAVYREPLPLRRAAARPARPLPGRARRHEPRDRPALDAQPRRRRARPARDRRALRPALRGDPAAAAELERHGLLERLP